MAGFQGKQGWTDKILDADSIWTQVKNVLTAHGLSLPTTLRRPDVRLIVDNLSGVDRIFRNPANHANDKTECIPASGENTAAMIMVAGDTLEEQHRNAETLCARYDLGNKGLSDEFLTAIHTDRAGGLVTEAYGPAPYESQAGKLDDIVWRDAAGTATNITPVYGAAAAYGARPATAETVFIARPEIYVKGTNTTPELVQTPGMAIAVSQDWQTGAESTRPIVASVAREFYGQHFDAIPAVNIHPDNRIRSIDLKNGTVIDLSAGNDRGKGAIPQPR